MHVPYVLEFFHFKLGTILHYKFVDGLEKLIIVDPIVLFKGISQLVTMSFMNFEGQSHVSAVVRKSGEIPASIIQPNQAISDGCPLTNQHLVNLLVHFKLMHFSVKESSYFMPCLLLPDPKVVHSLVNLESLDISPPPLLILFEEGFVPVGLFSGIVNDLSLKWDLNNDNRFRNRVAFVYPPGVIELRQCIKYIEVRAVGDMIDHCDSVREEMLKSLKVIASVQPHLNESDFFLGFYCPHSHQSGNLHPSKYTPTGDGGIICLNHGSRCYSDASEPVPVQCTPWFKVHNKYSVDHIIIMHIITSVIYLGKEKSYSSKFQS